MKRKIWLANKQRGKDQYQKWAEFVIKNISYEHAEMTEAQRAIAVQTYTDNKKWFNRSLKTSLVTLFKQLTSIESERNIFRQKPCHEFWTVNIMKVGDENHLMTIIFGPGSKLFFCISLFTIKLDGTTISDVIKQQAFVHNSS